MKISAKFNKRNVGKIKFNNENKYTLKKSFLKTKCRQK